MWPDKPSKSCSIWNAITLSPLPPTNSTASSTPSRCPTRSAPESTIAPKPAPFTARSFSSSVPARVLVFMAKRESSSIDRSRSGQHRHGAELVGGHRAETEELEIERNLLEQNLGAGLRPAAQFPRGTEQRRDLLLHHDFADEGLRAEARNVERQRIVRVHSE